MSIYKTFVFEDYTFLKQEKKLILKYSFDSNIFFEETIVFDFDFIEDFSMEALDRAFFGLFVMAGISYFKAALPSQIVFKKGGLCKNQKQFFEKIYLHGLGEFFYQNKINPKGKINFTDSEKKKKGVKIPNLKGCLIPIGGGKDSLTTVNLLAKSREVFDSWTVNSDAKFELQIHKIQELSGGSHLKIRRTIAPKLLELNKHGALNGHVPISSILAFLSVCTVILTGKQNILFSNEHSANEATMKYLGMEINHQYSKTLEFERDFQNFVHQFISSDIYYFSFLRPFTELKIAELFVQYAWKDFSKQFSSCNRNFTLFEKKDYFTWCGKCPKCAFVFTILSPFVKKEELISLFGGNLFADKNLAETFYELLGLREKKPFECVGEIMEMRKAMVLVRKKFQEVEVFISGFSSADFAKIEAFDYSFKHPHAMPQRFENFVYNFKK
ncbi:endonuclease domain-containing protein [Candidatus Gracilibacteria bacterium]|nr:endonuclease domain-containing protein [Candidatus Gracilibacteria bacterium]